MACGDRTLLVRSDDGGDRFFLIDSGGRRRELPRSAENLEVYWTDCDRTGQHLVYVAARRTGGTGIDLNGDLWMQDVDGKEPRRLTTDGMQEGNVVFHPDGRSVLFSSRRGGQLNLWELPLPAGEPVQITTGTGDDLGLDITPDGKHIVFNVDTTSQPLLARSIAGGTVGPPHRITLTRHTVTAPQASPDGTHVIAIDDTSAVSITVSDGSIVPIAEAAAVSVTLDGSDVIFASPGAPSQIHARRPDGTLQSVGSVDGEVRRLRVGPDGFVHAMVVRDSRLEAWRVPLAGGLAELDAPAPWSFVHPAPRGGWRLMTKPTQLPRTYIGVLVAPGKQPAAGDEFELTSGDFDAAGTTFVYSDRTHARRIDLATGKMTELFPHNDDAITVSPDGDTVYAVETVGRVRRHMITNFGERPRPR
jgi:dipeptidyl aminopeptidase/acylaminoacyl peptidase